LRQVLAQINPFGEQDGQNIMTFLERIWELNIMPSEDSRYSDAYGDIQQHIVNNDDWTYEELFEQRLDLITNDESFKNFIETLLHPDFHMDEDEIIKYYLIINPYLEKENYTLVIVEYVGSLPLSCNKIKR
ncbi:MAG: hypothetical protein LDL38_13035, partial [Flavobacterium piscis]|nr:hypothetical protein [Flavobacterium piscis]